MEEKFIVEGPKLKLTLSHLSVGEIVLQALRNHGDRILQVSKLVFPHFDVRIRYPKQKIVYYRTRYVTGE